MESRQRESRSMFARSVGSAALMLTGVVLALGLLGCNEAKGADLVGNWNLTTASRGYLPQTWPASRLDWCLGPTAASQPPICRARSMEPWAWSTKTLAQATGNS